MRQSCLVPSAVNVCNIKAGDYLFYDFLFFNFGRLLSLLILSKDRYSVSRPGDLRPTGLEASSF